MDTNDTPKPKCDTCGEVIDVGQGDRLAMLEVPHFLAEQIEDRYPSIANQILRSDGTLSYHDSCSHLLEELVPLDSSDRDDTRVKGSMEDYVTECSVCGINVVNDKSRCGRCGNKINNPQSVDR